VLVQIASALVVQVGMAASALSAGLAGTSASPVGLAGTSASLVGLAGTVASAMAAPEPPLDLRVKLGVHRRT